MTIAALIASMVFASTPALGYNSHPGAVQCLEPGAPGAQIVRVDRYLNNPMDQSFISCMDAIVASGRRPLVTTIGETRPSRYAREVSLMATRWPGSAWEIWNEQNMTAFWKGTEAEYMRLLRAASRAIRKADPTATVVLGGTSKIATRWMARAYKLGLRGLVDVVAVHPYEQTIEWQSKLRVLRRVMTRYGDSSPVWLTEFGWSGSTWVDIFRLPALPSYVQAVLWYDLDRDL